MKIIYGKKSIKRYTRTENVKWKTFIVKEKSPEYLSRPKIFYNCKFNLFQFCYIWIKPLSHQAWSKNLQSLEYCCRRAFLFLFWRISLTKFSIHLASHSKFWHLEYLILTSCDVDEQVVYKYNCLMFSQNVSWC